MSWFTACNTCSATYGHWNAWQVIGGDATICSNYRGMSLLTIAYRILPSVLCERLKPFVNKPIGSYQCCFKPGKSNIDQIFPLRQNLENTRDKQIDTYHLRRF